MAVAVRGHFRQCERKSSASRFPVQSAHRFLQVLLRRAHRRTGTGAQPPCDSKGAWLPRYFTRWHGRSLVVNDDTLFKLTGGLPKKADNTPLNPPQSQNYAPDGADIELLYGKIYEFRCRLADLTGGGPVDDDDPERPAPAPITKLRFLRHVPPKALRVATDPPAPAVGAATDVIRQIDALSLRRPLMGYPEFIFAGVDRAKVLQGANNLFTQVTAAKDEQRAIGVADPDVAQVVISVQVRLPAQDPGPAGTRDGQFREIYQVTRSFTAYDFNNPLADQAPLQIGLDYVDVHDLEAFVADIAANPASPAADLPIPRARDVRLRLTPFCADVPNHYAEDKVREGLTVDLATRAPALDRIRSVRRRRGGTPVERHIPAAGRPSAATAGAAPRPHREKLGLRSETGPARRVRRFQCAAPFADWRSWRDHLRRRKRDQEPLGGRDHARSRSRLDLGRLAGSQLRGGAQGYAAIGRACRRPDRSALRRQRARLARRRRAVPGPADHHAADLLRRRQSGPATRPVPADRASDLDCAPAVEDTGRSARRGGPGLEPGHRIAGGFRAAANAESGLGRRRAVAL